MRHISDNLKRVAGVKPTNKKNTFKASNTVSVNLKTAEVMYLDYFNNFLTVGNFADHYGLTVDQANAIIRLGRNVHIMKNLRNLKRYVADKDGDVYSKETGEQIYLTDNADYKLQTDEKVFLKRKNKTIELIRRFTPEQIKSLYNQSNDFVDKELTSSNQTDQSLTSGQKTDQLNENTKIIDQSDLKTDQLADQSGESSQKTDQSNGQNRRIKINGVEYNSLNESARELGVSRNTIKKRLDDGVAGYSYI